MEVRVLAAPPSSGYPDQDYICVHTATDPFDDTVVLATIERMTDRTKGTVKRVKTLLARQRMSADAALDLATSYAERKQVPDVYTDSWPVLVRSTPTVNSRSRSFFRCNRTSHLRARRAEPRAQASR